MTFWLPFAVSFSLITALCWMVVWARRANSARLLAVALFLVVAPGLAAAVLQTLGNHRPLIWEQAVHGFEGGAEEVRVLGHKLIIDEGIYLYLEQDGPPLALVLPWDQDLAQQLEDAAREGRGVFSSLPYERSLSTERRLEFHPLPQPKALPDKPRQNPEVLSVLPAPPEPSSH